jgi:hypothetical protein
MYTTTTTLLTLYIRNIMPDDMRIQQCGDFRCSTSLNATFDGT